MIFIWNLVFQNIHDDDLHVERKKNWSISVDCAEPCAICSARLEFCIVLRTQCLSAGNWSASKCAMWWKISKMQNTVRHKVTLMWVKLCQSGGVCSSMCNLQCAICNVQCSMFNVQCAMCNVQCAICNLQSAICNVQCAMCNVQCAMCNVQCAMCNQCENYKVKLCQSGGVCAVQGRGGRSRPVTWLANVPRDKGRAGVKHTAIIHTQHSRRSQKVGKLYEYEELAEVDGRRAENLCICIKLKNVHICLKLWWWWQEWVET